MRDFAMWLVGFIGGVLLTLNAYNNNTPTNVFDNEVQKLGEEKFTIVIGWQEGNPHYAISNHKGTVYIVTTKEGYKAAVDSICDEASDIVKRIRHDEGR